MSSRTERPGDAIAAAELLRECAVRGETVLAIGAGRALSSGGAPKEADVQLSLEGISGVVEYVAEDLTVTVRAGTRLSDLEPVLRARGQWLPGSGSGEGTVGGLVASGHTGRQERELYGRIRERIIGMQVAGADGRLSRSGGRVVKNVTGYDLYRLHCGAGGAFGVITEVSFRLDPLPERQETVTVECSDGSAIAEAWLRLRREGPDPACVEITGAPGLAWRARAVFLGEVAPTREAALWCAREWSRHGSADRKKGAVVERDTEHRDALAISILVRPSQVIEAHAGGPWEVDGARVSTSSWPGAGEMRVAWSGTASSGVEAWRRVAEGARRGEWHFRVEQEPPGLTGAPPAFSADPGAFRLLAELKRAFDPQDVLRPGSYSAQALERAASYFAPRALAPEAVA